MALQPLRQDDDRARNLRALTGIAAGEPTPGGGVPGSAPAAEPSPSYEPTPGGGIPGGVFKPSTPTPSSPAYQPWQAALSPPARSLATGGTGGKDGQGHADTSDAADRYRAEAGENLRGNTHRNNAHLVAGSKWQSDDPNDPINGMTVDEVNAAISKWDDGYRRATGQVPDGHGGWVAAGGAGAGAAPGPGGGGAAGAGGDLGSDVDTFIRGLMSGKEGPFTPEMQAQLRAQSATRRSADLLNANQSATLAAARGGTATSPAQQAILAENARGAREGAAGDAQGISLTAAQENFKARLTGLDQAQATIQRTFQDRWNKASDATQRYQIDQEYQAKMAEIAAQREMAQSQLGAAGAAAGRARGWELEDRADQRAYEQSIYERDLPIELLRYQLGSLGN